MNNTTSMALAGLVLASLAGASAQANPFAATPLAQGYQLVGAEAACGGHANTDKKTDDSAKKAADNKAADNKAKEGMCGEGKCGEGMCGENMQKADASAEKTKEAKCGAEHQKASQGSCGGAL